MVKVLHITRLLLRKRLRRLALATATNWRRRQRQCHATATIRTAVGAIDVLTVLCDRTS